MNATRRSLRLNAVLWGLGNHEAAWRMPESDPLASTDLRHWLRSARIAEEAGFDALFLGDVLALLGGAENHVSDTLDPLIVLSAIGAATARIGLIGTVSTSFEPAFHIARRLASLDHLTGGRAGWNIVTSSNPREAANFGLAALPAHAARYEEARDVVDAVIALWDSWDDDARLGDRANGRYFDPAKVRTIQYAGPHVRTAGPLNTPRSPQGRPVLVQAGSSEAGRDLAARRADVIFTAQTSREDAQAFYADVKRRAAAAGRDPDRVVVMPGIMPVVAESRAAAEARLEAIDGGIVPAHAVALLSEYLQRDVSTLDLDRPLPPEIGDVAVTERNKSRFALLVGLARRDGFTLRQLLRRVGGGRGHYLQAGTAADIADTLQDWLESGAADGFNVMCPALPGDLDSFARLVIPELRRRGLRPADPAADPAVASAGDPAGRTLRQRYGLPHPAVGTPQ
jgi:FMN-dependent oxidoreductase (nitrilotriacetate monooxygenase family)